MFEAFMARWESWRHVHLNWPFPAQPLIQENAA
jgi:hypothetical protein